VAGTLVAVGAAPSELVEKGKIVFHVVDLSRVWVEVRVPAADVERARKATGVSFRVDGRESAIEIDKGLVALGGMIDPTSGTAPLIFELENGAHRLTVGTPLRARVFTGETQRGLAVPAAAIVDHDGQSVVYVQSNGESFERRAITLGVRDGAYTEVRSGLKTGERVVSRGAYAIRLASASGTIPEHGHVH
jgi:RND family efflux transporter MFP subunit